MVQEICHQLSVSGSGNILFLDDLRNHKIPEIGCGKTALDYHEIPINVVSVFNRESVVDLRNYGIACTLGALY